MSARSIFCHGLKNHLKALVPLGRTMKMKMKRTFVKHNNVPGDSKINLWQNLVVGDERGGISVTTEKVWF